MPYIIIGAILVLLDIYAWLSQPAALRSSVERAFAVGIPLLVALGMLSRPKAERAAILVMSATLATSLNRDALGDSVGGHLIVLCGAAFLMWSGYRMRGGHSRGSTQLIVACAVVLASFLMVWLAQLV